MANFSSTSRTMKVERLSVRTADIDRDYGRVEFYIDGIEFEFSGPDAQVVGAQLNTAGEGDMYAKTGAEDTIRRVYRVLKAVANASAPGVSEAREILRAAVESYDGHP